MLHTLREYFRNLILVGLSIYLLWNVYTAIFSGYISWEGEVIYFNEEPIWFFWFFVEVYTLPVILLCLVVMEYLWHRKHMKSVTVPNPAMKAKRLRRRKRKKKRLR